MAEARPKLSNDEDDMLEMQKQFLAGKIKRSAEMEVLSAPNRDIQRDEDNKMFSFSHDRTSKHQEKRVTFEDPEVQVLTEVVEKMDHSPVPEPVFSAGTSFPELFSYSKVPKSSKSGSLFAQQMRERKALKEEKAGCSVALSDNSYQLHQPAAPSSNMASFPATKLLNSTIIGQTEAVNIHKENLQKLSSMTEGELALEKEKLLQTLDPKIVAFINQRVSQCQKKASELSSAAPTLAPAKNDSEKPLEDMSVDLSEFQQSNWIHMDVVENEKLAWMSSIPRNPAKTVGDQQPFAARFDFEGRLLHFRADIDVTSALYHHGEEEERPGYTIDELLTLSN